MTKEPSYPICENLNIELAVLFAAGTRQKRTNAVRATTPLKPTSE